MKCEINERFKKNPTNNTYKQKTKTEEIQIKITTSKSKIKQNKIGIIL